MGKKFLALLLTLTMAGSLAVPAYAAPAEEEAQIGVFAAAQALSEEADAADAEYDGYIVKLKSGVILSKAAERAEGVEKLAYTQGTYTTETLEQAEALAAEEFVEYVEPNYIVKLYDSELSSATVPNDRFYETHQWNLGLMNVQAAWNYGIEGQDLDDGRDMDYDGVRDNDPIVIAVIDSGLKQGHEDIDWDRVLDGQDFYAETSTDDQQGHGTFVTGLIMATKDNEVGIAGIAQNVYVMPLKVFGSANTTATSIIVSAINYAAEQRELFDSTSGAQGTDISVINMSLGGESGDTTMKAAVDRAIQAGIIVICAAGNDGDATASYPAQYAIGVGSTDSENNVSYYSQRLSAANGAGYENKVWVSAPGQGVTSLYYESTTSYVSASGTSFSSPEVAALAALCKGVDNSLNHESFKQLLKETAVARDSGLGNVNGQDIGYGWGTVDFGATLNALIGDMTGTASVRVAVKNEAGASVSGAAYTIYQLNEDETRGDPVQPDETGTYTLQRGQRYEYEASAPRYDTQTGVFAVLTQSRNFTITLQGRTYTTRVVAWNTADEIIPGAEITVTSVKGRRLTRNSDGSFGTRNGEYRYTVTAEGYFPASGTFTVNDEVDAALDQGKIVNALLYGDRDVCSMDFEAVGADGDIITAATGIEVKNSAGEVMERYTDGLYKLHPGSYTYTAVNAEYQTVTGSFAIREADKGSSSMRRVYLGDKLYYVYVDVMPLTAKAAVTVKNGLGQVEAPLANVETPTYKLINGTYQYEVTSGSKVQYNTLTGTFTVAGKKLYLDLTMTKGDGVIDDGTSGGTYLTVNSSLYSLTKLQEHTTTANYQQGEAQAAVEGITLQDLLTSFTANVRPATSAIVTAADGNTVTVPAEKFETAMVAWKVNDSEGLVLAVDGDAAWLENVTLVTASYHEHTETVEVLQEATCTAEGSARYTCVDCGNVRTEALPALGHDFDDSGICRRCGAQEELDSVTITLDGETVSTEGFYRYATSDTYTMVGYYNSESHTVTGITLTDLAAHFLPDKCVTSITAVSNDDSYTQTYPRSAFDNTMIAWLVDGMPGSKYETDNGLRMAVNNGSSGAWIYSPAVFTAAGGAHSYDDGVVTPPTCAQQGYTTWTCTGCGSTKVGDYTPATGLHIWDNGFTAREPGCETAGTKVFYCTECGGMKTETIPALGHAYENNGVCARCGKEKPVLPLSVDDRTKGRAALTQTADGLRVVCDKACVVLLAQDGSYTLLTAEVTDEAYTFALPEDESAAVLVALKGDVDLDGSLNSADAALAKRFAAGLAAPTVQQKLLLGLGADQAVTGITALRVQRAAAELYDFAW